MTNTIPATMLLAQFKPMLRFENWLENVGSFSETAPTFSPFRCRKIATAQEAKKWLQNDELWEGVQRVAQNDLFTQFQAAGGKGALINEFGQALAQFFHTQQSSLKAKIASKQLKPEPTYLALYSIALGAFTEYAAAQTADVNIALNTHLLAVLNVGYLSCGWAFAAPPADDDAPFDYDSGWLYVY